MNVRIILLILSSCISVFGNATSMLSQKPVHVFITAGQSNTDGRVNNKQLPSYIKFLATDTVDYKEGKYPYCKIVQNRTDGHFVPFWPKGRLTQGLWAYDAVTYRLIENAIQEDFYVVKWAVGGTSITFPNDTTKGQYWSADTEWLKNTTSTQNGGKSLLLSFTEAIDAAIDQTLSKIEQGYHIDAFLWHQGESDSKYMGDYYKELKGVISHVRNHLTQKTGKNYLNLPFVFGTVTRTNRQYSPKVEEAMLRIAEEDPNAYLVDMSEGELQKDRTHFNEVSAEYLGREMFKVLDKILDLSGTGFRIAKYKGDKSAAISYTFDDGLIEHYTLVAPHLDKLNFRGTFWINGSRVNENTGSMKDSTRVTWGQLKDMSDKGHEISNHGWAHRNFSKFPIEDIRIDIQKNDSAIWANIGILPVTFCYPNNNKKVEGVKIAEQNRVGTRKYQRSIGSKVTTEDLEKWVNNLVQTEGWGVGMTHGITYGYDCFRDPEIFWKHLEKVKTQEDKIWVGTFREVAAYTKVQKNIEWDISANENEIVVTPRLSLNKNLFTEHLTGILDKTGIKKVRVKQGGNELKIMKYSNKILFDFDPFGGPIHIQLK